MPIGYNEYNRKKIKVWDNDNKKVDLVILDIDGVMTDGTKSYDAEHNVISKNYCDRDFTAIKRLKDAGVSVCFLSGDARINEGMAKSRKIDFFYSRDKITTLKEILSKYKVHPANCAYVGDDIFDIPVLEQVQYSACPSNAPRDVKECCKYVLSATSGDSVIAEFYDILTRINRVENSFLGMHGRWDSL
jgi:3-deoxy-D-manno-octulosonate 8-phosphate phosphatase (KDO 8-P phosphatase)